MLPETSITFPQKIIAHMAGVSLATINRFISLHEIKHIEDSARKAKRYSIDSTRRIIAEFLSNKVISNKKIQVFYNFKGGTGKTTLCYQVASTLSYLGFKVLAIDCDPQAHLTSSLKFEEMNSPTMFDVMINNLPIQEAIINVSPGLDMIPSNLSLTRTEIHLNQLANREKKLVKIMDSIKDKYDFILIDTNPTISVLNRNAMYASDRINVVCETQPYSLKGLEMLVNEIQEFAKAMDMEIEYGIIANKYDSKTATAQEILGTLRVDYKNHVMSSVVRRCEEINISAKKKMPICALCNDKSIAFEDILDLVRELIDISTFKKENVSNLTQKTPELLQAIA